MHGAGRLGHVGIQRNKQGWPLAPISPPRVGTASTKIPSNGIANFHIWYEALQGLFSKVTAVDIHDSFLRFPGEERGRGRGREGESPSH